MMLLQGAVKQALEKRQGEELKDELPTAEASTVADTPARKVDPFWNKQETNDGNAGGKKSKSKNKKQVSIEEDHHEVEMTKNNSRSKSKGKK